MSYKHGVYVNETPTSILPPAKVGAGLPVVFGTAPVHLTEDPAFYVNKPVLAYTYAEAVAALGYVGDFDKFTICEFLKSHFALFAVAPVVLVNVLDPAVHNASVASEAVTLVDDRATLSQVGALRASIVVKSDDDVTTYVLDTDYVITYNTDGRAIINRVTGGSISAGAALSVDYDHIDASAVVAADIIGGVDGVTGALSGLELLNQVFPRFRLVPGQVLAPKFSTDPAVSAVMLAKASNINAHFKAMALTDIPTGAVDIYTDAPAWKNDNNVVDPLQVACWPKVKLGTEEFHMSTQLAGLICKTDSQNSDIPYVSPSNKNFQMDSAVLAGGEEVWLGPEQAAYLNGEGIITALNFVGGWKAWGNRTACYPSNTDPKDSFLPIRRMYNWVSATLVLTYFQKLDAPLNKRQIQTVLDSANLWLNGLTAIGALLGGRVEFLEDENPTTDLADGISRFHVYLTPPSPNREIDFILEYDPAYLNSLFA